ncbi:unnamed protein product [Adineta ricciae]|uniref:Uncharacterized protein n=1 Tax=Adineta ricciae TaxID=249248 RepID=A0A815U6E0_ADIRI|nr:unnamed protein product [Adineta ricciae]
MRPIIIVLLVFLVNFELIMGNVDCNCQCCTTQNCNPVFVGSRSLWFCSEPTTCTKNDCNTWYPSLCPKEGVTGQTRAVCNSNAQQTVSTASMIFSILAIALLLINH